jgi:DNA-binding response OmpR family regulator
LYKIDLYQYDLLVLDINLITGSGLDILKLLKKNKKESAIIIISANNSSEELLKGLDLGADDYLTEPFHLAELNSPLWLRSRLFLN